MRLTCVELNSSSSHLHDTFVFLSDEGRSEAKNKVSHVSTVSFFIFYFFLFCHYESKELNVEKIN